MLIKDDRKALLDHDHRLDQLSSSLERLLGDAEVLKVLEIAGELPAIAGLAPPGPGIELLKEAFKSADPLARVLLVHGVVGVSGARASHFLVDVLAREEPGLKAHAAWALRARPPIPEAVPYLLALSGRGGFSKLVADRTLTQWREVRQPVLSSRESKESSGGLRIAQVFLQGLCDPDLDGVGIGQSGGLNTLLVQLAREFSRRPEVDEVVTIARAVRGKGIPHRYSLSEEEISPGNRIVRIPFGPSEVIGAVESWGYWREIREGLRRVSVANGPFDMVHLRFADVGSLAGAEVFRDAGVPICFTIAPDPHAVVRAEAEAGHLDRDALAGWDRREHVIFRMRLLEWLKNSADRFALMPRGEEGAVEELHGYELAPDDSQPYEVVPEGCDVAMSTRAITQLEESRAGGELPAAIRTVAEAIDKLPIARRGLPLLISSCRLHPMKGVQRIVPVWAEDDKLFEAFNLLIIGGNLEGPDPNEAAVLEAIEATCQNSARARDGLIMAGHLPHRDTALLLAAGAGGYNPWIGSNGVYVCGSTKEEFGLAIVEALAAGLPVVAPQRGGPASYVGDAGVLCDTLNLEELRLACHRAAALRHDSELLASTQRRIRHNYGMDAMVDSLLKLYRVPSSDREMAVFTMDQL